MFDACRDGFFLAARQGPVLLTAAIVPMAIVVLTAVLIAGNSAGMTPLRIFLFSLPAYLGCGWFFFVAVRLWLFGEMPGSLPQDPNARRDRMNMLQATVITYILWKAVIKLYEHVFVSLIDIKAFSLSPDEFSLPPGTQVLLMVMLGVLFWAVRFRPLPVLAAAGYPLGSYIRRAHGIGLSFRLLGLVMVCVEIPRAFVLGLVGSANIALVASVNQALGFFLEIWLFAAFTCAMKTMLKDQPA